MKKIRLTILVVILIASDVLLLGKITHKKFNMELWMTANYNSEENLTLR